MAIFATLLYCTVLLLLMDFVINWNLVTLYIWYWTHYPCSFGHRNIESVNEYSFVCSRLMEFSNYLKHYFYGLCRCIDDAREITGELNLCLDYKYWLRNFVFRQSKTRQKKVNILRNFQNRSVITSGKTEKPLFVGINTRFCDLKCDQLLRSLEISLYLEEHKLS